MSEASRPTHATWTLQNARAQCISGEFRASVDLTSPRPGLSNLSLQGQSLAGSIFEIGFQTEDSRTPARFADAYIRQSDLVATYVPTEKYPFRTQVYWRGMGSAAGNTVLSAVDLIVSVQTHLLDTRPQLDASISLPGKVSRLRNVREDSPFHPVEPGEAAGDTDAPACYLWRFDERVSFAGMIHPADRRRTSVTPDGDQTRVMFEIFSCFLEKGVILRARLRGVFLPRQHDETAAVTSYRDLIAAKPPLTT